MNEHELATRTYELPEMFADRVPADELDSLHSMAEGGEWGELLDLLVAGLLFTGAAVTRVERDRLQEVLEGWGLPTGQLDELVVRR